MSWQKTRRMEIETNVMKMEAWNEQGPQNTVTAGRLEEEENKAKMMMEVNLKVVKMKIIVTESLIPIIHD